MVHAQAALSTPSTCLFPTHPHHHLHPKGKPSIRSCLPLELRNSTLPEAKMTISTETLETRVEVRLTPPTPDNAPPHRQPVYIKEVRRNMFKSIHSFKTAQHHQKESSWKSRTCLRKSTTPLFFDTCKVKTIKQKLTSSKCIMMNPLWDLQSTC